MDSFRPLILALFLVWSTFSSFGQERDYSQWINFGGNHTSKWLQIAPGQLGPNALPVPRMDYAKVGKMNRAELGGHFHQMKGDTAINSFVSFYWVIAPGRAAIEIWGQPTETFHMGNEMRDKRQIYTDDNGWVTQAGDLIISTYVQLLNERKFIPSVSINYTMKTTTGSNTDGRYTDAEMNYFYMAAGKSFEFNRFLIDEIRLAGLLGFYVWQTNKVEMGQDEGKLYEFGIQFRKKEWSVFAEFGGYNGWDAYEFIDRANGTNLIDDHNDPLIIRTRVERKIKRVELHVEYQTGFRDYHYQSFKLGAVLTFDPRKF